MGKPARMDPPRLRPHREGEDAKLGMELTCRGKRGHTGGSPGKLITSSGLPLQELVPVGEEDLLH